MRRKISRLIGLTALMVLAALPVAAQAQTEIPSSLVTPDTVETRIGTLKFKDGAPDAATAEKAFDNLDFTYAFRAFMDNLRGVSIAALRKGMQDIGMKENEVLVFSDLMDAKSLFLTANADTIYVMGYLDLSKGPVVIETPPKFLGAVQDAWFRWVIDLGAPGPDRGEGGKYLIVPPGYDQPLPEGYFVARARTDTIVWFGRSFLENGSDPKPVVEGIKKFTKVYNYHARWRRHAHCRLPRRQGKARPGGTTARNRIPRRQRQGDEYTAAQRLDLLRDIERSGSAGAGHLSRPRTDGADRRARHHQGQTLRARRTDEEDHDRGVALSPTPRRGPCSCSRGIKLERPSGLLVVQLPVLDRL